MLGELMTHLCWVVGLGRGRDGCGQVLFGYGLCSLLTAASALGRQMPPVPLMLCYTKVESSVAFVVCVCAWCEFGVVLSGVFEVCVCVVCHFLPYNLPPCRLAPSPGYCGWLLCE